MHSPECQYNNESLRRTWWEEGEAEEEETCKGTFKPPPTPARGLAFRDTVDVSSVACEGVGVGVWGCGFGLWV